MNFVEKWIFQKGAQNIMGKLFASLDGYKTYILAAFGIIVGVVGHFWGPISMGPVQIPAMSWDDLWKIVWNGGLFAVLRNGVSKTQA